MQIPKIGQKIRFRSVSQVTSYDGKVATIRFHGNNPQYPGGVPVGLVFDDGHRMWARLDECEVVD